jgi:ArsR family transcriptional regulator
MHGLPFADGSFDHVLLLGALAFAHDPFTVLCEAARVLAPGGTLVGTELATHDHADHVAPYDHVQLGFDPAELAMWLGDAGLAVDLCAATSRERRAPHLTVLTIHAHKEAR